MDVIEALQTRRSIKSFLPKPVPRDVLLKLVDIARYSPSGANKNPWRFVLVTEKDLLTRLGETHRACKWLASAPAGIAVVADTASTRYWLEDCSIAAYTIWLAAAGMGLGAAWAAMYQSDNAEESERRQKFVRETLAVPGNLAVPMILAIGYPDVQPPERKRLELKEIVSGWECYTPSA